MRSRQFMTKVNDRPNGMNEEGDKHFQKRNFSKWTLRRILMADNQWNYQIITGRCECQQLDELLIKLVKLQQHSQTTMANSASGKISSTFCQEKILLTWERKICCIHHIRLIFCPLTLLQVSWQFSLTKRHSIAKNMQKYHSIISSRSNL